MEDCLQKIAIFDFCETLVRFQTADEYLRYVIKEEKMVQPTLSGIGSLVNKIWFRIFNVSLKKNILLKKIKGLSSDKLDEYARQFYKQFIVPMLIEESVNYLRKLKEEGYYIIIASAGFDIYIKYFANEAGVDKIICSQIGLKKGRCIGKLQDYDLIGRNKVRKIKKILHKQTLRDGDSVAVSDSHSDLPLLKYCKKAVVVCKRRPNWVKKDMEVLLWT